MIFELQILQKKFYFIAITLHVNGKVDFSQKFEEMKSRIMNGLSQHLKAYKSAYLHRLVRRHLSRHLIETVRYTR